MDVRIVEVPTLKVLGAAGRGKYQIIPELLGRVFHYAMSRGVQFGGPPLFVCHEKSVEEVMKANEEGTAEVEVAIPVVGDVEGSADVKAYELPGGKMARIVHKGPYDKIEPTYNELWDWLGKNGKKLNGNVREVYLNDPNTTPPEELLTEIYAPIE